MFPRSDNGPKFIRTHRAAEITLSLCLPHAPQISPLRHPRVLRHRHFRPGGRRDHQSVVAHARPVRGAVIAVPVDRKAPAQVF